jgi:hypothetical protein
MLKRPWVGNQPKCFVSTGSTSDMIKEFVDYLVEISQESYVLLLERFSDIYEQINERIARYVIHLTIAIKYC